MPEFLEPAWAWATTSGLRVVVTVVLAFVAMRLAKLLCNRLLTRLLKLGKENDPEQEKSANTMVSIIRTTLVVVIIVMTIMMVLAELGIDIAPILAAAGVVGLAVGFGARTLVEDVISGFFILVEDMIREGDVVSVGGHGGLVERVTLRMVVLRDGSGSVHYVRNGQIGVVTNMTKDFAKSVFEIGISYREDVDRVIGIMKQVAEDLRLDPEFSQSILEELDVMGLDRFAESAVIIKAAMKTKPIKQWGVAREYKKRLKVAFEKEGVEIPFPHLTVVMNPGTNVEGKAPAAAG